MDEVWGFYQLAATALVDKAQVNMDQIQSMTFRYLIISSYWGNLAFYWTLQPVKKGISMYSSFTTSNSISSVNMTGTVNTFSVLTGFEVTAASSSVN